MARRYARYINHNEPLREHALVCPIDQSGRVHQHWAECICRMHSWGGGIDDDVVLLSFAEHIAKNTYSDVL